MNRLRIGVAGIGNISGIYLKNLSGMFSRRVQLAAVTDIIEDRAAAAAKDYGVRHIKTIDDMARDDGIDVILNITQPRFHHAVAMKAVTGGKHIYNEKPLCTTQAEAADLLRTAAANGTRVGGAPDTFLGAGIQTCRKLIDDGWIGRPIAASAFMLCHGHESWHPAPAFYYQRGGGPMFDMGPYYLTALVNLLGPVKRVSGSAQKSFETRTITSEPLNGTVIDVEVPTHIAGVLDFASGAVGTIITSFDVWSSSMPKIEIYGSEGSLQVPDPNTFGGPVYLRRHNDSVWREMPLTGSFGENSRGLGITDMCEGIAENRPHRASGELCRHVLDIMHGIHDASASGKYCLLESACEKPALL
ncbi:MAG: Gfo/Idh/MocA family oxidoreductase [Treponema sp.]|jgi:predicted dehydrogenase|nr:Gfo/Idh/MocA family oxidoreductase [Treponema sp.]